LTDSIFVIGLACLVVAALIVGIAFSGSAVVGRALIAVDRLSTFVGQTFSWCILLLTFAITYEVIARKFFAAPTNWGYDSQYMLSTACCSCSPAPMR
jgi:hypothetical protein